MHAEISAVEYKWLQQDLTSAHKLLLFRALNHQLHEVETALKSQGFPTQDISSVSRRSNTE